MQREKKQSIPFRKRLRLTLSRSYQIDFFVSSITKKDLYRTMLPLLLAVCIAGFEGGFLLCSFEEGNTTTCPEGMTVLNVLEQNGTLACLGNSSNGTDIANNDMALEEIEHTTTTTTVGTVLLVLSFLGGAVSTLTTIALLRIVLCTDMGHSIIGRLGVSQVLPYFAATCLVLLLCRHHAVRRAVSVPFRPVLFCMYNLWLIAAVWLLQLSMLAGVERMEGGDFRGGTADLAVVVGVVLLGLAELGVRVQRSAATASNSDYVFRRAERALCGELEWVSTSHEVGEWLAGWRPVLAHYTSRSAVRGILSDVAAMAVAACSYTAPLPCGAILVVHALHNVTSGYYCVPRDAYFNAIISLGCGVALLSGELRVVLLWVGVVLGICKILADLVSISIRLNRGRRTTIQYLMWNNLASVDDGVCGVRRSRGGDVCISPTASRGRRESDCVTLVGVESGTTPSAPSLYSATIISSSTMSKETSDNSLNTRSSPTAWGSNAMLPPKPRSKRSGRAMLLYTDVFSVIVLATVIAAERAARSGSALRSPKAPFMVLHQTSSPSCYALGPLQALDSASLALGGHPTLRTDSDALV